MLGETLSAISTYNYTKLFPEFTEALRKGTILFKNPIV